MESFYSNFDNSAIDLLTVTKAPDIRDSPVPIPRANKKKRLGSDPEPLERVTQSNDYSVRDNRMLNPLVNRESERN